MSKTQSIGSAFGSIAKTLANKKVGKEVSFGKTRATKRATTAAGAKRLHTANAKVAAAEIRAVRAGRAAAATDPVKAQKKVTRHMRKFARGLKAMGVRRLRFLPFADIAGGVAFRAAGKTEDRVAELTNLYTSEGVLKSVRSKTEDDEATVTTVLRLNYSKTSRVEVMNKGVVFYA